MIQIREEPGHIFISDSEMEGKPAKATCIVALNNGDVFHFSDAAAQRFNNWWNLGDIDIYEVTVQQVVRPVLQAGAGFVVVDPQCRVYSWDLRIQRANITWCKFWKASVQS